jgi:hypothetical protein
MSDKHERKLQKAREEEAEIGGDRGAETKPSLIEKILHPFHHKDQEHDLPLPTTVAGEPVDSSTHDAAVAAAQKAPHTAHPASSTVSAPLAPVASLDPVADKAGIVINPRTGLPTDPLKPNVAASANQPTASSEPASQIDTVTPAGGPDWEAIQKAP